MEYDNSFTAQPISPAELHQLFSTLPDQAVEQFQQAYQLWFKQQHIQQLQIQIQQLQQRITNNTLLMEQYQPSAIALATLVQLQASGVEDTVVLEQMLERGEIWLDHAMELLRRCEQLDLIGASYTEWCKHALEGAYDWMDSIADPHTQDIEQVTTPEPHTDNVILDTATLKEVTEDQLLQKLMSDEDETEYVAETEQETEAEQAEDTLVTPVEQQEDTVNTPEETVIEQENVEEQEKVSAELEAIVDSNENAAKDTEEEHLEEEIATSEVNQENVQKAVEEELPPQVEPVIAVEAEKVSSTQGSSQWPFIYEEAAEENKTQPQEDHTTEQEEIAKEEKPITDKDEETKQRGFLKRSLTKILGR